jgi:imidazolonepropionase-like amidohydrolase
MERMQTRNLPFLAGTCAAYGLDKEQALQLITSNTAKILGIDATCGTLEQGKDATLFISEGDALDMRTNKLTHAFIQGRTINLETHQSDLNKKYKEKYNQK